MIENLYQANIYKFKVNNKNIWKHVRHMLEINKKTENLRHWLGSNVFIVNFEHILQVFLVCLLLTLNRQKFAR